MHLHIHYSLFISLCSVTSDMTGYSHLYHSIKFIHCGATQRDVFSDKMVLPAMTYIFYFMLCRSSLLSTAISFVYKDKWWFHESMSVIFCMENNRKRIFLFPLLKRQSEEDWQNEKHHSKENNTNENPIPRREIFKSVDHVKYEGQVRPQHLFLQFSRWAFKLSCYLRKLR